MIRRTENDSSLREILFANRGAAADDLKKLIASRKINFGERELTRALPLRFRSDGASLLDWRITGAAGGVGKLGKNYLKPKTEPIPNGAAGTYQGYQLLTNYAHVGNTFTIPSNVTRIVLIFSRDNNANISYSDVGDVMLVEGSTIPTAYDADTTLNKYPIMQGATSYEDNGVKDITVGESQILYSFYDIVGEVSAYGSNAARKTDRCKSRAITVSPNTTYSIKIFNANYTDIKCNIWYATEPGTITPTFSNCSVYTQKSIPSNGTFVTNNEQWISLQYSHSRRPEYYYALPVDVRPLTYEYCNYYATLKAGTYKVMIDTWGNNRFWSTGGYYTGIQDYTGCVYDNFNYDQNNLSEWFALVAEDNTVVIAQTDILPSGISSKYKKVSDGAPYPNYFHKEVTFTLEHDTKIGLFHRAYYESQATASPAYHRFMIVDSDVEAEEFTTTGAVPCDMNGYSAWEKYSVSLPVTISSRGQTQTVTVDLGDSFLGAGDTISLSDTHTAVPTYSGTNTITVDSEVQPSEMYIKYVG